LSFSFVASLFLVFAVSATPPSQRQISGAAFEQTPAQIPALTIVHKSQGSFSRGGFEVISGPEARAVFVSDAPAPTDGIKLFALERVLENGWDTDQFSCLVELWERESNWRWNAENKSSGAYGIPKSLPASKMATIAADWRTNPETQVLWGLQYIDKRYESPCGALVLSDMLGWF
jgi:hypothetical protein